MNVHKTKVAVLVYDFFEQIEFESPVNALLDVGINPVIVTAHKLSMQAMKHTKLGDKFKADEYIDDIDPSQFIALILPGGVINADKLRMNQKAREWVNYYMDNDRLIAAICHAPWFLVSADGIEERRLTSYYTLQDDIRNVGAQWIDMPVVKDGNLITSRQPDDLEEFDAAIIGWLDAHKKII